MIGSHTMRDDISYPVPVLGVGAGLVEEDGGGTIGDKTPVLHRAMGLNNVNLTNPESIARWCFRREGGVSYKLVYGQ